MIQRIKKNFQGTVQNRLSLTFNIDSNLNEK